MPIHHLTEIDRERRTAICSVCGPTDIRARKIQQKYTAYICATQKRAYAAKYHLLHSPPHPSRIISPSVHNLSEIDDENKTAVCSQCGPVRIYVWRGENTIGRRCSKASIQNVRQAQEKRKVVNRQLINEHKVKHGCQRCGYNSDPLRLDFHRHNQNGRHEKNEKLLLVARERLLQELEKYEVLCESCCRLVHNERGWKHRIPLEPKG